jgi:archaellum component FlaC
MDTYKKPEHMRAPENLSALEIKKSLEELDNKIKTLKARVNATASDSNHNYHEHIAALEVKRAKIAEKIASPETQTQTAWDEIKKNINNLGDDLRNLIAGFGK